MDDKKRLALEEWRALPISTKAAIVWPKLKPIEGQRRIRVAIAFSEQYPDGLPDDFGD